jgi:hypothetical protein
MLPHCHQVQLGTQALRSSCIAFAEMNVFENLGYCFVSPMVVRTKKKESVERSCTDLPAAEIVRGARTPSSISPFFEVSLRVADYLALDSQAIAKHVRNHQPCSLQYGFLGMSEEGFLRKT